MPSDNRIKLHFINKNRWIQAGNCYATGSAFLNGEIYSSSRLANLLSRQETFERFGNQLRALNGFFASILTYDSHVFLAVDHVRSLPLFYGIRGERIFVSDDAFWVRDQVHDNNPDDLAVAEFLLTRSVSGNDTLSASVKQVQAGEAIALTVTSDGVRKEVDRFYIFDYGNPTQQSFSELSVKSDSCLLAAFKRLAEYANGSTIVVPSGGGLDSRLILLMLKKVGYDNILAFTYGRPSYQEVSISRKVASALGIPWQFIPYSNEDWRRWYNTNEWSEYSKFASRLSSVPHLQDWPAVWELKKQGLIPENSVFAAGQACTPSDSTHRLPVEWLSMREVNADELAGRLCEAYCTLQDWSTQETEIRRQLPLKMKSVLNPPPTLTPAQAIGLFDRWWWESSWAKFIVNSVRVYEFWGYRWWLPLWDIELVHFWRALPFDQRLGRRFEKQYVRNLETNMTGKKPIPNASAYDIAPKLVGPLDKLHLRRVASRIRARREYRTHRFAWYGLIPENLYHSSFHGKENINTYLANQTIKQIFPQWKIPERLDFLTRT